MQTCNQKHWAETVDYNRLSEIRVEDEGIHRPVNHGVALDMFRNVLYNRHISIVDEKGLLSPDEMKYVYVADISAGTDSEGYRFTNGFVNYNNKQKSFTILHGERVFVCSNECFTGQLEDLKRRHVGDGFLQDLRYRMNIGIDRFLEFVNKRQTQISRFRETPFGEPELGEMIVRFHRDGEFSNTNIGRIVEEYDNPSYADFREKTAWNFHNACTHVFKNINNPVRRLSIQKKMNNFLKEAVDIPFIDA